jgi:hypothetical protein
MGKWLLSGVVALSFSACLVPVEDVETKATGGAGTAGTDAGTGAAGGSSGTGGNAGSGGTGGSAGAAQGGTAGASAGGATGNGGLSGGTSSGGIGGEGGTGGAPTTCPTLGGQMVRHFSERIPLHSLKPRVVRHRASRRAAPAKVGVP